MSEDFKAKQYQDGKRDIQKWLQAEKRYIEQARLPPSKLREDILWSLGVRKKNRPYYKPEYRPYCDAMIDELNRALQSLN